MYWLTPETTIALLIYCKHLNTWHWVSGNRHLRKRVSAYRNRDGIQLPSPALIRVMYKVSDASSKFLSNWHDKLNSSGLKVEFLRASVTVYKQWPGLSHSSFVTSALQLRTRALYFPNISIELEIHGYFQKWSKSFVFHIGSVFIYEQLKSKKGGGVFSNTHIHILFLSWSGSSAENSKATFQGFLLVCVSKAPLCEVWEWINLPLLNLMNLFW